MQIETFFCTLSINKYSLKNQSEILTSGVLQRFGGGATRNLPATLQALLNFHTFFLSQKNVCMRNKFLLSAEDLPTSQV